MYFASCTEAQCNKMHKPTVANQNLSFTNETFSRMMLVIDLYFALQKMVACC